MDSKKAAAVNRRSARVQRSSADDVQDGEIWVGPGSVFASPFIYIEESEKIEAFQCWLTHGPRSPWWVDDCEVEILAWFRMVTDIGFLVGKTLATAEPIEKTSHADVLAKVAAEGTDHDGTPLAPSIFWLWAAADHEPPA